MHLNAHCSTAAVQLAVNNVLSPYLQTQFGYSVTKSGNLAATFGLLNFVSRPLGGVASDLAARRYPLDGLCMPCCMCCSVGNLATGFVHTLLQRTFAYI